MEFSENYRTSKSYAAMDEVALKVIHLDRDNCKEVESSKHLSYQIKSIENEYARMENEVKAINVKKESMPSIVDIVWQNVDSVSKSLQTVNEQIANLKKSLELERIKSSENIKRYATTIAHNSSLWESYDAIYERRPLAMKKKEMKVDILSHKIKLAQSIVMCNGIHEKIKHLKAITDKLCTSRIIKLAAIHNERAKVQLKKTELQEKSQKLQDVINNIKQEKQFLLTAPIIAYPGISVPVVKPQTTSAPVTIPTCATTATIQSEVLLFSAFEIPQIQVPRIASPPRKTRCYQDLRNQVLPPENFNYSALTHQDISPGNSQTPTTGYHHKDLLPVRRLLATGFSPCKPLPHVTTSTPLHNMRQESMELDNISTIEEPQDERQGVNTMDEAEQLSDSCSSVAVVSSNHHSDIPLECHEGTRHQTPCMSQAQKTIGSESIANIHMQSSDNDEGFAMIDLHKQQVSWNKNTSRDHIEIVNSQQLINQRESYIYQNKGAIELQQDCIVEHTENKEFSTKQQHRTLGEVEPVEDQDSHSSHLERAQLAENSMTEEPVVQEMAMPNQHMEQRCTDREQLQNDKEMSISQQEQVAAQGHVSQAFSTWGAFTHNSIQHEQFQSQTDVGNMLAEAHDSGQPLELDIDNQNASVEEDCHIYDLDTPQNQQAASQVLSSVQKPPQVQKQQPGSPGSRLQHSTFTTVNTDNTATLASARTVDRSHSMSVSHAQENSEHIPHSQVNEHSEEELLSQTSKNLSQTSQKSRDEVMNSQKRQAFLKQLMQSPEYFYVPREMVPSQEIVQQTSRNESAASSSYFMNPLLNVHKPHGDRIENQSISESHAGGGDGVTQQMYGEKETHLQALMGGGDMSTYVISNVSDHKGNETKRQTISQFENLVNSQDGDNNYVDENIKDNQSQNIDMVTFSHRRVDARDFNKVNQPGGHTHQGQMNTSQRNDMKSNGQIHSQMELSHDQSQKEINNLESLGIVNEDEVVQLDIQKERISQQQSDIPYGIDTEHMYQNYEYPVTEMQNTSLGYTSPYFRPNDSNAESEIWSSPSSTRLHQANTTISEGPGWQSPIIPASPDNDQQGASIFRQQTTGTQNSTVPAFFMFGSNTDATQNSSLAQVKGSTPPTQNDKEKQRSTRSEAFTFNFDNKSNKPSIFKLF